jgi:hypothetical protein
MNAEWQANGPRFSFDEGYQMGGIDNGDLCPSAQIKSG